MRIIVLATLMTLMTLVLSACAAVLDAPPPEQCPQPRFTGKAPDPDYGYTNPLSADPAILASARNLYLGKDGRFGCAACHGENGEGNGVLANQYDPPPRNFACPQTVNAIPDGQLYWIIRNGSPGTGMSAHPQYSEAETWQLVLYLRHLASQNRSPRDLTH